MKEKIQSPSSFILLGIIFGGLFGIVSLGVYMESSWIDCIDLAIIEVAQSNVTETKTVYLSILSEIGNIRFVLALTICLVFILFVKRWFVTGIWLGGTIIFCAALGTKLIKMVVDRVRPDILPLIEKTTESFPSGHVTSATIFYGLLGLTFIFLIEKVWKKVVIGLTAFLLIVLVLMTRVYLGVHYPTDVIAGFLYGMATVFISAGVYQLSLGTMQQVLMRFNLMDHSVSIRKSLVREKRNI